VRYATHSVAPVAGTDPREVGPYRIVGRLGRGGESRVYLGTSPRTGAVAVKVIRPRADDRDPTCGTEFGHLRQVDGAYVVPGIAYGACEAGPYLVTAYQPDAIPANLLPAGRIGKHSLWRIAAGLSRAIRAVHDAGLIHCDVKPANVLVSPTEVRLIDFGIARDVRAQPLDAPRVYCSQGWAAPEQLSAGPLSPAVDVFGWACVIAFLGGGQAPFAADTDEQWIMRVRRGQPDVYGLPPGLDALVRAALSQEPDRRPDATDLAWTCAFEAASRRDLRTW
jgi:serine/threonine protein kinase